MGRPWLINAFGCFFLLLPLGNYAARVWVNHAAWSEPGAVLAGASPIALAMIFFPLLVGIGLLTVSRWGWWLFVVYAPALCLYSIYVLIRRPVLFNVGALAQTVIAFAAIRYFLRRDIYAPYLADAPRGWRGKTRLSRSLDVTVDGKSLKTRDVSELGCYLLWPASGKASGDAIKVHVSMGGREVELAGTVARVDEAGLGVRFTLDEAMAAAWRELIAKG
jgi:hypothetical protein